MAGFDHTALSEGERKFLEALNEFGVRYLLVGMSAALLQGARGSTEDLDLWFERLTDAHIGEAARRLGGVWVTRSQPPLLGGGDLGERWDVVTHMDGLPDFAAEYVLAKTLEVDGVPIRVLPLERILASKRAANRPKDQATIYQLESTLKILDELDAEAKVVDALELVQTCSACPEQYDAMFGDRLVGYLRLRQGEFTVACPDVDGQIVLDVRPRGDGSFDDDEREDYLRRAKAAIANWIRSEARE
jgi:hypothetical protein